jgi:hypothetical protein
VSKIVRLLGSNWLLINRFGVIKDKEFIYML